MFGFSQAPVLATGAQHGFKALAQTLLVTLQLGDQAAALLKLVRPRQLRQARRQLLLALLEGLGLIIKGLYLAQLLLVAGLQGTDLPDPPATGGDACGTEQQGHNRQAIATAWRGDLRLYRRIKCGLGVIFRQGCFAHVSVLCVSESGRRMPYEAALRNATNKAAALAPRQSTTFSAPAARAISDTRGLGTNNGS